MTRSSLRGRWGTTDTFRFLWVFGRAQLSRQWVEALIRKFGSAHRTSLQVLIDKAL